MINAELFKFDGGESEEIGLPEGVFGADFHNDLLYRAVRTYRTNGRSGSANTKTRSEVSGSNRKPWRQKGTGRARHGSRQSPLWSGGGVTFGPKPKDYDLDLPKKMKRKAVISALSVRFEEGNVKVIDRLGFEEPKTKRGLSLLERLDLEDHALIIIAHDELNWVLRKTFSNLPTVDLLPVSQVTAYSVLKREGILITESGVQDLEERLLEEKERVGSDSSGA